jgi:hypothetical protein
LEVLEAFRVMPPSGEIARIYEFRGRNLMRPGRKKTPGKKLRKTKQGHVRRVYVAADNIFDAAAHLHRCRPDFRPNTVVCLGYLSVPKSAIDRIPRATS